MSEIKVTKTMFDSAETLYCPNCGCADFTPCITIKKLSSLHPENKTGQDIIINVPSKVICINCKSNKFPIVEKQNAEKSKMKTITPDKVNVDISWKKKV